jgi:L-arabinose isomerase
MDFMNLNQSAHGDREHGFIHARLGTARKVVVGYWQDPEVLARIGAWMRAAVAFADGKAMRVARLGDNMREVAVTDGNKVSAQIQFGWQVNGYGVYEVAKRLSSVTQKEVDSVMQEYEARYDIAEEVRKNEGAMRKVREQAAIELALRRFLADTGAGAFTTTFEDLEGLPQLPGLAVQRLMEDGFGFGAEGDWKTAALVRAMKVMGRGLPGGTSFMEDYTYHLEPENEMVLAPICSRCAPRSRRLDRASKYIPSRSGEKMIRRDSCSTRNPGWPSPRPCSISAIPSGLWQTKSEPCRCPTPCPNYRSRARCGSPSPTSRARSSSG